MSEQTTSPASLIGRRIGNYEIVGMLGRGGMGEVYLGRHPMLGKEVAVKVLSPKLSADQNQVSRFRQEAMAACRIGHPAIVNVMDFGSLADGRNYCVMERLEGESLGVYLDRHGRMDLQQTLAVIEPVIEALAAAHDVGVVHRDIKPDNIFLHRGTAGRLEPKVLDFGIAKLLHPSEELPLASTQTGSLMGTPLYMSPEQAAGATKRIGPGSDVYSVGALLFHMLTGRPPYVGDSFGEILLQHMQARPPSVRSLRPEMPEAVDAIVQTALAKKPEERFHNMRALGSALNASAASVTVPHTRPSDADGAPMATRAQTAGSLGAAEARGAAPDTGPLLRAQPWTPGIATEPSPAPPTSERVGQGVSPAPAAEEGTRPARKRFIVAGASGVVAGAAVVGLVYVFFFGPRSGDSTGKSRPAPSAADATKGPPSTAADSRPDGLARDRNPSVRPGSAEDRPAGAIAGGDPMSATSRAGRAPGSRAHPSPASGIRAGAGSGRASGLPHVADPRAVRPVIRDARDAAYEKMYRRSLKWDPDKDWEPLPGTGGGGRAASKIIDRLARQQLELALRLYRQKNCEQAISWSMSSYRKKRSATAAFIVGVCACRLKKVRQAKDAYRRVGANKRKELAAFCRKSGITLP